MRCHDAAVPKKPRALVKTRAPKFRMTATDERLFRRAALAAGMDFSEFARAAMREKVDRMRADGVEL